MINLYFSNGEILLYSVDNWSELRRNYRIIGEIVGNSLNVPSLPMKILPEEACLLLSKNLVTVVEAPHEVVKTEIEKAELEEYEHKLLKAQEVEYKKTRKEQLETVADQIIVKQKVSKSKEEIVNEELKKMPAVTKDNMIWPTHVKSNSTSYQNLKTLSMDDLLKLTTPLKTAVYSDLWNQGYYITQGHKFGGDYLVYIGDPVCHHAIYIVRCQEPEKQIFPSDIIAFGRLGTSVKKRAVWASFIDSTVSYITTSWIDS